MEKEFDLELLDGQYKFSAYDLSGQPAFHGTISLSSLEQNHMKGHCTFVWPKNRPEWFLEEDGDCEGLLEGTSVSIDSAPALDDAGLLLDGHFRDGRIIGIWRTDGFATSEPLGKFEAVRK